MKISLYLSTTFVVCSALFGDTPPDAIRILDAAPLRFEPAGPVAPGRFVARGPRYGFSFAKDQAIFQMGAKKLRLQFAGASKQARLEGSSELKSRTNVFIGNDPSKWRKAVPNFGRLQVTELYRGIDLVYYGNGSQLEYDLTLRPGAQLSQVKIRLQGADPALNADGDLIAGIVQKHPVAYQTSATGVRIPVDSRYIRHSDGTYGFAVGAYDHSRDLVIDPVLTFSLYLGGSFQDIAYGIGHDKPGFLYVGGTTASPDFTLAGASLQTTLNGSEDIFLAKIDPNAASGAQVVYSTYLGGELNETFGGMAVSPGGEVYITGTTSSTTFPQVNSAQSAISGTSDAFVVWLDFFQTLGYSTYLGGTGVDSGAAVTYDAAGLIYVTGSTQSADLPIVGGPQMGNAGSQDAFLAVLDRNQSASAAIIYSSYFGGSGWETARGIALGPDGTVWIVGSTYSADLPVAGYCYDPSYNGNGDAFAAQFNITFVSSSPVYATYLGGSGVEEAHNVVVDPQGVLTIVGYTTSTNFPVTSSALQTKYGGNTDVFISRLNPVNPSSDRSTQLVYSTYFGGKQAESAYDLKQDPAGALYIAGYTMSAGLPVTANAVQSAYDGTWDAFALKLDPTQSGKAGIDYLTYLGSDGLQVAYGIDFDGKGNIYLTGFTTGPIFDKFRGASRLTSGGNSDAFVAGFSACAFDTSLHSEQFPSSGGTASIGVTALNDASCPWTASSTLDWVTIAPTSGTGSGAVTLTVAPNTTGSSRTGTITIAGVSFLVGQD